MKSKPKTCGKGLGAYEARRLKGGPFGVVWEASKNKRICYNGILIPIQGLAEAAVLESFSKKSVLSWSVSPQSDDSSSLCASPQSCSILCCTSHCEHVNANQKHMPKTRPTQNATLTAAHLRMLRKGNLNTSQGQNSLEEFGNVYVGP